MIASAKPPLALKKRVLSLKQTRLHNFRLGEVGESQALDYLKQRGYSHLFSNLRLGHQEVDLVMIDSKLNELVFVEVKTRSSARFGHPGAGLSYRKLAAMRSFASRLSARLNWPHNFRLDLITVYRGRVEHFRNISW